MTSTAQLRLGEVQVNGESFFKIADHDEIRPFFMSIVSDANHWMFISSNGGLTAGRKNAQYALFPYYTDDKITESAEITGSKTIFRLEKENKKVVWEPFSIRSEGLFMITRNLYKNTFGNKVMFEEINHDLQLSFRYQWSSSNLYGFVKEATLINRSDKDITVDVLDGIQNILPFGVGSDLQNKSSNLVDAYKRSELVPEVGLGIYALSAIIVDKAEPSEALKANVVWSLGMEGAKHLVSSLQLDAFREGRAIGLETDIKGEKGAYFLSDTYSIQGNAEKKWMQVANVNQNHSGVVSLCEALKNKADLQRKLEQDIEEGTKNLIALTAASDGIQSTSDKLKNTRHFSNTLFNIMRGGIFDDNYQIEKGDFSTYLRKANRSVFAAHKENLSSLPEIFDLSLLLQIASSAKDNDFERLCREYLPLKFSRRHGDPSRPWNVFSINTNNEIDGSKILDYQGNWRDIFQNWEALAYAYPEFIDGMILKFFNASTFDGYNPYRVTKDGFDWEIIEPDDPWSYIGYWGDHQIIYSLKFLEFIQEHYPDRLSAYFKKNIFVYANVPYKMKGYKDLLQNPKDTIDFDSDLDYKIREGREKMGADAALLKDENGAVHQVNFIEKVLASVLAKLSNFIPEGGIWMNTQRPEWNDANNALVGNGVSMVTLCYLRRYLKFFSELLEEIDGGELEISTELLDFYSKVNQTFSDYSNVVKGGFSDKERKSILDALGGAADDYRTGVYKKSFSGKKKTLAFKGLKEFFELALRYSEQTIVANRRSDNLYHAYNLMTVENDHEVSISYLSEMLEGQVAVLSSGYLKSKEALAVLDGLKKSALFREDQYSYILYPNKNLPRFLEKNTISKTSVSSSALLQELLSKGNREIIEEDENGGLHFNGNFKNAYDLQVSIDGLGKDQFSHLTPLEKEKVVQIFEEVFNHKEFTGRSGTFYGYEGLGSIYWHMVSKLLLAVQECCFKAIAENESEEIIGRLKEHYYEINEGIGVHKSPKLYGAFPTDPYSHTPAEKGAQQPGMTGQVKEDILSRFGELGVFVEKGRLIFKPYLLRKEEFLEEPRTMEYVDLKGETGMISLKKDSLGFTYCQIPIVYELANTESLTAYYNDGSSEDFDNLTLNIGTSKKIFERTGEITKLKVGLIR